MVRPFRVAASAFVSRLVVHEPALERLKVPTTDATDALRTFELEEIIGVWVTSVGRVCSVLSHVHVGTGNM